MRARRRDRADAAGIATAFATLLAPLLAPDGDDLADGLRLFREVGNVGAFDAVLAAAALRREHITHLVSADRGFAAVPGLAHLDPGSRADLKELGIDA